MWNKIFFLYSIAIIVISGMISTNLADVDKAKHIKYLNEIVLATSIALAAFAVGIMFGQSSFSCANPKKLEDHSIYYAVALFVFSLVIEGLLIAIVTNEEFKALEDAGTKRLVNTSLIINSVGIAGGIGFIALPHLRMN
jgi:lysylphosphatidylglycerol synthetase-like protein (DUF2156 family)